MDTKTSLVSLDTCIGTLQAANQAFQDFLGARASADTSSYYRAQELLKDGKGFFKESLNEISEIIGSLPEDASPAFKKWKENFLEKIGILSQNTEFEALRSELKNDDLLLKYLTQEEVEVLLVKHFESQRTGHRKLANIKARILFDKIQSLMIEAEDLEAKSKERLYQLR
jgi:hypothetical protein